MKGLDFSISLVIVLIVAVALAFILASIFSGQLAGLEEFIFEGDNFQIFDTGNGDPS